MVESESSFLESWYFHQISGYFVLSYSYRNHFTLNVNGRFDASNKFGSRSNERFLPVWSVSGSWNLQENILKNVEFISELRLRDLSEYKETCWRIKVRI